MTMLNIGNGVLWLLLVAWQQMLASPSDVDCRLSGAGYSGCRFRWLHPCSGSSTIRLEMKIDEEDSDEWLRDFDLSQQLDKASVKASMLKKEIRSITDLYVISRIGIEGAHDLDVTGFRIDGMPSVEVDDFDLDLASNIHRAYEHLARIAVYLSHMIKDENEATAENVYFGESFQNLENGLYYILCSLAQIVKKMEIPLSSEVIEGIFDLRVVKVNRNSIRHVRDYLILRNFEKIAETLSINLIALQRLRRQ